MTEKVVTEELCKSRRKTVDARFEAMQDAVVSIRDDVSKLLRIITEGNGTSLMTSVAENTSFRIRFNKWMQEQEVLKREERDRAEQYRKQRRNQFLLTLGGWIVTMILFGLGVIFRVRL